MNYLEFSSSNLILFKTCELLLDEFNEYINCPAFKDLVVRKCLCGTEGECDTFILDNLSNDVKSVGINYVEFIYDYFSNKVTNITLKVSMKYIGYCNLLYYNHSYLLYRIEEFSNYNIFDNMCNLHVIVNEDAELNNTLKELYLLAFDNSIIKISYEIDLSKYKNVFKLDLRLQCNLNDIYYNLLSNNLILKNEPELSVKLIIDNDESFYKFFNLFINNNRNLTLGFDSVYFKLIITVYYMDNFKDNLRTYINSNLIKKDLCFIHVNFLYNLSYSYRDSLENLISQFRDIYNM